MSKEIVPTPTEVINANREEIRQAETKEQAAEAIEPVAAVCAMYDRIDGNEELPAGGPHAIDLAEITPLTVDEIRGVIEEKTLELVEEETKND